jgi:hypothetical protein
MAHLRVRNLTGADLDSVQVRPPVPGQAPIEFGPLDAGATSATHEVPALRRIAAIEASGATEAFTLQPYDLVGEEELPPGEYVYELRLAGGRLTLDLKREGN